VIVLIGERRRKPPRVATQRSAAEILLAAHQT
jgi:hypothetical protein